MAAKAAGACLSLFSRFTHGRGATPVASEERRVLI